jgi:RHS repeat-associated protein
MRFFSNTTLENQVCRPKSGINLYPFGQNMPGRNWSSTIYKYGPQSQEKDNEIFTGASDFGAREYDGRIGKFLSRDPFANLIANQTPYSFAGSSPITFVDFNGGFKVPYALAQKYPKLNSLARSISNLANKDQSLNNPIILKFIEWSGLPQNEEGVQKALEVLSYGSGPTIKLEVMEKLGGYPITGGEDILIAQDLADDLEKGTYSGTDNKLQAEYANRLTIMFTMWHEGIHYMAHKTGFDNKPDKGGRDNGDKAEIEGLGFNIGGRKSFIEYWNQGKTPAEVAPIKSLFMGTTSWNDSRNYMNSTMGALINGPFVIPISGDLLGNDKSRYDLNSRKLKIK